MDARIGGGMTTVRIGQGTTPPFLAAAAQSFRVAELVVGDPRCLAEIEIVVDRLGRVGVLRCR